MAEAAGRRHAALIAGLFALFLAAAPVAASEDEFGEAWRWVRFGEDSGLPSERVLVVLETRDGTPWASTVGGPAWYDGHAWIPVLSGEPLARRRAEVFVPFGRDGIAAIAMGGEILLATRTTHERLVAMHEGRPLLAFGLADAGSGELLIVAGRDQLEARSVYSVRPAQGPAATLMPGAPRNPYRLTVTPDGDVLCSGPDGLFRLDGGAWNRLLPGEREVIHVEAAVTDGDDTLLALASPLAMKGLWRLRAGGAPAPEGSAARTLCRLADGSIMAGLDSGVVSELRDGAWHAPAAGPEAFRGMTGMAARANGDAWFATDHGLYLFRRSSQMWTRWRMPGSDLRNHVSSILPRDDGSTWIATDGGLLVRRVDGTIESIDAIEGQTIRRLTAVGEDARGRVWIGSGGGWAGAWRFDGAAWTHVGAAQGLPSERLHAIKRTRDGRLWFLGLPAAPYGEESPIPAVHLLRADDTFEPWGAEQGLDAARVYDVAQGPDGALWFATLKGPWRWRDGKWRKFTKDDGLRMDRTFCIVVGRDGRAWFGSQRMGLGMIDTDDRVSYLDQAGGLVDDDVWGLAFDDTDRLWVATRDGLGMVSGDHFTSFRGDSGLPIPVLWPVVVHDDRVMAGTLGAGVGILDLADVDVRPPRVRFEPPVVEEGDALLRWSALSWWGDPEPRAIETRVRVDDRPWTAWSTARSTVAHDLAPGAHEVRVEARGLLAGDDAASAQAAFRVAPPAWRQPAFLVLATAFALSAGTLGGLLWARRIRERQRLEDSERRYRKLVETATEIVFAVSADGRVAWSNPAGAELLGRAHGELSGHDVMETVAPESRASAREALLRARRTGEVVTAEVVGLAKDGSRRLVEVTVAWRDDAELSGWQGIGRDITERRLRDEEKQRAQRLESLGLLAGGIAHDFNNVLAGVVGHAGLALAELPEDSPSRARLEQVERAAMHCADLARQILDYAGRGRFAVAPLDLGEVVRDAVSILDGALPRGARVKVQAEPSLPRVEGDAAQLQRVVANLLRNAAEASDGDAPEILLAVRSAPEGVAAVSGSWAGEPPKGPVVLLQVTDAGHGMDADTRSRAFDPFFSTRRDGRGLGLAATLGIVRAHGGAIAVDTAPGRGATFTVALKVAS